METLSEKYYYSIILLEKSERSDRYKLRSVGLCDLRHTISAALSLERCLRRTSDSQGAEGVVRAGLEDKGQKVSKQDIRVEHKVSVALLASRVSCYWRAMSLTAQFLIGCLLLSVQQQQANTARFTLNKLSTAMRG